jgi:hypothetical protein
MWLRLCLIVLALLSSGGAFAQNRVRTETIRPPPSAGTPPLSRLQPAMPGDPEAGAKPRPSASIARVSQPTAIPDIVTDLSQLPAAVAQTRERILTAARSGDLQRLLDVMQANEAMPVFSFSQEKNPQVLWRATYPESGGLEVLATLVTILETGFVHVDAGTPQEMYLWPYFARRPLKTLTAEQKVELFRIITGADYKDMLAFGAYAFYRVGIAPDGTWQYFVTGDERR